MEARAFRIFITESCVGHNGFPDWQECFTSNRNLKFSQLTLEPANDKKREKLVYVSLGEKLTKVG